MLLCKFALNYLQTKCFITNFFVRPFSVLKRRGGHNVTMPTKKHADVTRVNILLRIVGRIPHICEKGRILAGGPTYTYVSSNLPKPLNGWDSKLLKNIFVNNHAISLNSK